MGYSCGALLSPNDDRDYIFSERVSCGAIPSEYIPPKLAPVLNQGAVGSCVAHALATAKWYMEQDERKTTKQWSTQYIYHNRTADDYQGEGMYWRHALKHAKDDGVCALGDLPGNTNYPDKTAISLIPLLRQFALPQRISAYYRCTKDDINQAVYTNKAVGITIDVKDSFVNAMFLTKNNMILPPPKSGEKSHGLHAMCICGYTADGWLVQNSWDWMWGYNGMAILPYDYPISEAWTMEDDRIAWDILELPIGNNDAKVNGKTVKLDQPAQIIEGRTMVPLRFVAEQLGCEVEYVSDDKTVIVRKQKEV